MAAFVSTVYSPNYSRILGPGFMLSMRVFLIASALTNSQYQRCERWITGWPVLRRSNNFAHPYDCAVPGLGPSPCATPTLRSAVHGYGVYGGRPMY